MPRGDHSTSISLCIILLFIPFLNSSTRALLSYLLHLATLLNIWTNLFIIQEPCFSYSSFTTFADLLSPLLNSLFNAASSSPTDRNSQSLIQNLLKCSLSTHLPILSTYTSRSNIPTPLLTLLSSSFWYITYIPLQNYSLLDFHQIIVA